MEYNFSESNIWRTIRQLNELLWKNQKNRVIVLDFSHFSPYADGKNEYDIHIRFSAQSDVYRFYENWISEQVKDLNAKWRYFKSDKKLVTDFINPTPFPYKLQEHLRPNIDYQVVEFPITRKRAAVSSDFDPGTHLIPFVKDKNNSIPGECFFIFSQLHGDAQSILYLLLEKQILGLNGYATFDFDDFEDYKIEPDKKRLLREIDVLLTRLLTEEMVNSLIFEKSRLFENVTRLAIRAAMSQVMARNMSHNIGSHVLSKIITKESILKVGNSNVNIYQYCAPPWINQPITLEDKIAIFNSYLRTRMDYLADIATGRSGMEVSRYLLSDILSAFFKNSILLNHISGLESFGYTIKIRDCRGCPENCTNQSHYLTDTCRDIPISIPNDVFGYHALFIILENLIRNTAKHSGVEDKQVEFGIEIRDSPDPELYEIILYDDVNLSHDISLKKEELESFTKHCASKKHLIQDGKIKKIEWLVFKQNYRLNESVIDDSTNALRHGSWGLIEMDVSAAYLRKIPIENVELTEYLLDLCHQNLRYNEFRKGEKFYNTLKAVNRNDCLAYRFFLMKPKEILIIDEIERFQISTEVRSRLNKFGIYFINKNQVNWSQIYPHLFCIIFPDENFQVSKYQNPNFPARLLISKGEIYYEGKRNVAVFDPNHPIVEAINQVKVEKIQENEDTIIELAWKIWLSNKLEYFGISDTIPVPLSKYVDRQNNDERVYGVIFDDHGEDYKSLLPQHDYYEIYNSQTKYLVENKLQERLIDQKTGEFIDNPFFDEIELFKFGDGVFTKVMILDERIQEAAEKKYAPQGGGEGVPVRLLLEKVNIHVPESGLLNLNAANFKGYAQKIKKEIEKVINDNTSTTIHGLDFVVIHLGVIEKVLQSEGQGKEEEEVRSFIEELNSLCPPHSPCKFIITSGRGSPDNLPGEVPFLGYSVLSQYCIENRFKSFLIQALYATRPL